MSLNVDLIRASFEQAKPLGEKIPQKFYELLHANYPDSKGLFHNTDLEKQGTLLLDSLVFIVDNLENTDVLVDYLKQMGSRHVAYGAKEEHYGWVGDSLLKTFAFFFKEAWTDELNAEWAKAYGIISDTMIAGANEATQAA